MFARQAENLVILLGAKLASSQNERTPNEGLKHGMRLAIREGMNAKRADGEKVGYFIGRNYAGLACSSASFCPVVKMSDTSCYEKFRHRLFPGLHLGE